MSAGGEQGQCGWLKDPYKPSWQIAGPGWDAMLRDPARFERAIAAILTMTKPDLEAVQRAYEGR